MADRRREIELPVCPKCGHVSKLPAGFFAGKGFCVGPVDAKHKRVAMKPRLFVEVEARDESRAAA